MHEQPGQRRNNSLFEDEVLLIVCAISFPPEVVLVLGEGLRHAVEVLANLTAQKVPPCRRC
eukprot:2547581-Pyramimonas_sp.AAC.1